MGNKMDGILRKKNQASIKKIWAKENQVKIDSCRNRETANRWLAVAQ